MTFHVKNNKILILKEDMKDICAYMGSIIKDNDSIPILINGVGNHVHVLCVMSKNIALSKLIEEIKRHSSRWIKSRGLHYQHFAWQGGYGGFSVSPSLVEKTRRYIENQEEHHKKQDFKMEYIKFLKEYGVDYNEEYLWTD
jgi:putative transposase